MGLINNIVSKITGSTESVAGVDPEGTWSGSIDGNTRIEECPFVVFDTELSGLDAGKDFIVSIGAIKMTGGTIHISKEFYRLIRPAGEVSKRSVEIHGITPSELDDQEGLDAVLPDFLHFISDAVLVGHFIHIDLKFMNAALKQRGRKKLLNPALDTHTIHEWLCEHGEDFRKHFPGGTEKTDLFSVAQRYGITIDTLHNALHDSFITAQLFQKFLYFLRAEGLKSLGEIRDIGSA
jgi:DNA polymerase-3 subunit epsilon